MQAQLGIYMLLKIYSEKSNNFQTIGGLKTTRMVLNNQLIEVTSKHSENWRELIGGGVKSISISGGGVFTSTDSEHKIAEISFASKPHKFQLCFGDDEILEGNFIISSYEREGNYNEEQTYNITIESAGTIIKTKK